MRNSFPVKYCLAVFFCFAFFIRCAQIVQPMGGARDVKAPRAIKYVPDSAQTNFQGKHISILFDEYCQLGDLQKELIISPPMKIMPEITMKGKELLIKMDDTLKQNTTYVLNFGNAISDITENNIQKDFRYFFSTGNKIDTLIVSGIVKDAFTLKPLKDSWVMLYEISNPPAIPDSLPIKRMPSYFSKTKEDGSYTITHIKEGTYQLFAIKDENSNFLYDLPSEQIAFADTLLNLSKNASKELLLFKATPAKQKLIKAETAGKGCLQLVYAKPVSSLSFKSLQAQTKPETFLQDFSTNKDSISLWFPDLQIDSLHFTVTTNDGIADTVRIRTVKPSATTAGRGGAFKLSLTSNIIKGTLFDLNKNIELNFSHPIQSYTTTAIKFKSDSAELNSMFKQIKFSNEKLKKKIIVDFSKKQEALAYHLFIPPGTFTDIFGLTNDTLKIDFKTQEEKHYGSMKLKVKIDAGKKYVVELYNEKGVTPHANSEAGSFTYTYLAPGTYSLRIIYDNNGDGRWSSGNYYTRTQPEKIIYYPNPIIIRANWEQETEWVVE